MDPPSLMSQGLFASANASSFSLAEIWPFAALNGAVTVNESGGVLGGRRSHFEQNLSGFRSVSHQDGLVIDESTATEQQSGRKRRDGGGSLVSEDESSKLVSTSSDKEQKDFEAKRLKSSRSGEQNGDSKAETEVNSGSGNKPAEQSTSEPPKQDFIHVRARRGQATDSHSLAERARREKISERMRILQDLVPGCNKVIGKALVLDEIINYIQSLQCQVEFLSMKLEAVTSGPNPGIEGFPMKEYGGQPLDSSGVAFGSQATREYGQGAPAEWLHMQVGGGFDRGT